MSLPGSCRVRSEVLIDADWLAETEHCRGFIEMLSLGLLLRVPDGIVDTRRGMPDRNAGEREDHVYGQTSSLCGLRPPPQGMLTRVLEETGS